MLQFLDVYLLGGTKFGISSSWRALPIWGLVLDRLTPYIDSLVNSCVN